MAENNDLTIVLVIKDRPHFTFRWMAYANEMAFPFKVLVADGGKDELVTEKLSNLKNYPKLRYEYLRYPYDETYSEYYAKIADALSRVETEFAVLADDDDFYISSALLRAVEFLKNNKEFVACGGGVGTFSIDSPYSKDDVAFYPPSHNSGAISDSLSGGRVTKHLSSYTITCYDVHRTCHIREYYHTLKACGFRNIFLSELITSCLTVADGKVEHQDYPYLFRQGNINSSTATQDVAINGDFLDRMLAETWSSEFTKFVNNVASVVADRDGIGIEDAKMLVRMAYRSYLERVIIRKFYHNESRFVKFRFRIRSYFVGKYPSSLAVEGLKRVLRKHRRTMSKDFLCNRDVENIRAFLRSYDTSQ